jgi:hypothetical protein
MKPYPSSLILAAGICLAGVVAQAQSNFSSGMLKLEVFRDIEGASVDDLRFDPKFPDSPDETHYVTRFEIPASKYVAGNSGGIKVGEKLSGYLVPAQTANYVFYVSANESGELWLARDATQPENIELIASGLANYPARTYDTATPSSPIRLEANKRYYVEALVKQNGKEESLSIAWTKENEPAPAFGAEPIAGSFLGILTPADSVKPGAVSGLKVEDATRGISYLWLNWTAPADPGSTEPVARYDLRYSTQPITDANWANATSADTAFYFPSAPSTSEIFKVERLTQNTTYHFGIRAVDRAGNVGPLSNVAVGQTKPAASGDFEVLWALEFDQPGAEPTSKGDWKHRNSGQTAFNPSTQVVDGVLKCSSFNPTLDTAPKNNFTDAFIAEFKMRCLTPVTEDKTYDGVVFWVNMDTVDGKHAAMTASLQLMEDDTQRLNIINNGAIITNYTGLSKDFQVIRWEFDPFFKRFSLVLNGQKKGTLPYELKDMNDDRYATILSWGADGEFDYVRIGRPARAMDPRWELNFDVAGVDPTAKGDWKHRTAGQTAFDPASQVVDGLLKCTSFNPTLDTAPKDDFTAPFIAEFQMRCLTPVTDDKAYDGVVFWVNMDTKEGMHAAMTASLQLLEDGTQRLNIINNGTVITNYTGLSTALHTVRWEFDPPKQTFQLYLDGSDAGSMSYEKKAMNDDRYATILSWGAEGEFNYVKMGSPIDTTTTVTPQLAAVRSGNALVLSWPKGRHRVYC